ncbi:MAG: WecB/TagA/CpsF family glycosyltransferase [Polyangiaceae bacterium]|nr:WecB/TagA/CpsF family glycosyltransferase [Polyangiaceae bacterium]
MSKPLRHVDLLGMRLAHVRSEELLDHLFASLRHGVGGWIVTANLDILRRHELEPAAREAYEGADLRVADGMPLLWASALSGDPLPERVAGSTLTSELAARAAEEGRTLFLLGGAEGAALRARRVLEARHPSLRIVGHAAPVVSLPPTFEELAELEALVRESSPDICLVAFGSPKQEYVCRHLRTAFPRTWLMGVGVTLSFLAGDTPRAPEWMQRTGLEWLHRMAQDPERLVRRYLVDDLPFAFRLFGHALRARVTFKR